jgi:hypothetical protein
MNFSASEWKMLALPLAAVALMVAAGAGLIVWTKKEQAVAAQQLAGARGERAQAQERLKRIADEEREVNEKLAVYQRLKALRILGEEQRLEWADAMTRIRNGRELLDLRYLVERQRSLASVAGKPANVDFFASTMKVDIALLHEGDLLAFLNDLRESGNAYYSVRRCGITRTGQAATGATIVPRLRAECDIDLITILDRAAKA